MPTLFDSHEEFNDWFSKDIESSAENKSQIDESELNADRAVVSARSKALAYRKWHLCT
jgi:SNF2 family DNA or RNA helicase